jgi:sugar diacid utilization regulator
MKRCDFCGTVKKAIVKKRQYSIKIYDQKKKKRSTLKICTRKETVVYCPACKERMKAESINRNDPQTWIKYMEKNPEYEKTICAGIPVMTLKRMLFTEKRKLEKMI